MYTKVFEVAFPIKGSLINIKHVNEDLKMKIFLKAPLFGFLSA